MGRAPWPLPVQRLWPQRRVRCGARDTVPGGRGRAGVLGATGNARPHGPAAPGRPRPAPAPGLATAPLAGGGEHRSPWNCLMSHVLTPRPSHRARGDRVPFSSAVASASTMAVTARCPQATADTFGGVSAFGDPELQSSPAEFTERSGIRSGAISRNTGPRDKGGHLSLKSRHRVEVGNLVSHLGSAPPGSGLSLFSQQTDSCSKAELGPHVSFCGSEPRTAGIHGLLRSHLDFRRKSQPRIWACATARGYDAQTPARAARAAGQTGQTPARHRALEGRADGDQLPEGPGRGWEPGSLAFGVTFFCVEGLLTG